MRGVLNKEWPQKGVAIFLEMLVFAWYGDVNSLFEEISRSGDHGLAEKSGGVLRMKFFRSKGSLFLYELYKSLKFS